MLNQHDCLHRTFLELSRQCATRSLEVTSISGQHAELEGTFKNTPAYDSPFQ